MKNNIKNKGGEEGRSKRIKKKKEWKEGRNEEKKRRSNGKVRKGMD
jgi:hypothetical protein